MALSDEVRRFLEQPHFPVLATINPDGSVQQTPVWFELQGDKIMFNTRVGRVKDRNMRRDPRISLCFVDGIRSVTVSGTCQRNDDPAVGQADIRSLAIRYDGEESGNRASQEVYSKQRRVTYYLPIEHVLLHGFDE